VDSPSTLKHYPISPTQGSVAQLKNVSQECVSNSLVYPAYYASPLCASSRMSLVLTWRHKFLDFNKYKKNFRVHVTLDPRCHLVVGPYWPRGCGSEWPRGWPCGSRCGGGGVHMVGSQVEPVVSTWKWEGHGVHIMWDPCGRAAVGPHGHVAVGPTCQIHTFTWPMWV
jgi:hypothetical protein